MAQLNKVLLIGNLTRDPEVRYTPKGMAVADLGLATNRTWLSESGEKKEEVCFVNLVVWGKQAETAGKYLKKGQPIFVEGRLQFEQWEKNGEKRTTLKVVCERFQFLGSPSGRGPAGPEGENPTDAGASAEAGSASAPNRPSPPQEGGRQGDSAPKAGGKEEGSRSGGGRDLENDDIPF